MNHWLSREQYLASQIKDFIFIYEWLSRNEFSAFLILLNLMFYKLSLDLSKKTLPRLSECELKVNDRTSCSLIFILEKVSSFIKNRIPGRLALNWNSETFSRFLVGGELDWVQNRPWASFDTSRI